MNNTLVEHLRLVGGHRLGADLSRQLCISRREIRLQAEDSGGQVISTNLGYAHEDHVTDEEWLEHIRRLKSQAHKMLERAAISEKRLNTRNALILIRKLNEENHATSI